MHKESNQRKRMFNSYVTWIASWRDFGSVDGLMFRWYSDRFPPVVVMRNYHPTNSSRSHTSQCAHPRRRGKDLLNRLKDQGRALDRARLTGSVWKAHLL